MLREVSANLPSGGRLRPPHVAGIRATIEPPKFVLECERHYRDYFGPVCVGRIVADPSGTVVRARIRRSLQAWVVPALVVLLALLGWLRGPGLGIGGLVLLGGALVAVVGWPILLSLFSTAKYEAEADALDAVLRRTAEQAAGGQAVA